MSALPTLTRRGLVATSAALATMGATMGAGPAPSPSPRRIGTYGGAGSTGVPEVAAYEKWLGRPLGIVLDFLEMETWKGMVDEAGWMAGCWKGAGRDYLAVSVPMLVHEGSPTLKQGADGQFDSHYVSLAQKLVSSGFPTSVIRIGWEFNGGWYPWTARNNTGDYKTYWRRIVAAMRSAPGARFRYDWTATTVDGPTEEAYPGDDVVDLIGLDVYNQSWPVIPVAALRWQYLLHHPAGLIWHRDFAHSHGKPRSFPEWGTGTRPDGHGGGDDPTYIRNMLAWFKDGDPVDYACYWNYHAGDYNAKLTDGEFPLAAAALKEGIQAG